MQNLKSSEKRNIIYFYFNIFKKLTNEIQLSPLQLNLMQLPWEKEGFLLIYSSLKKNK